MHQAKAEPGRQTDGRVRPVKRKTFCSGPSCAFGRDVFSAKCLNKVAVLHFAVETVHPLCFAFTVELSHLKPLGERREGGDSYL